ncbi:hypothetical protein SAMD00019534_016890 [Acytostelium subglobosum LB1]|uniref:hypothetical protein n=1 Tax=Acytostelium subglobosum LB1 TaxID=1410327 RepID=UPI000644DC4D|nr:hypothetical protein SAMD00019534_016890 [Acytostelium subglobosum LB1]GAM18514.1 hypothetical protein SAMD00019534_016890 [Acytostelium subglobosum LB1]|eukprot:XP_012757734.1 hypothetical protein SAMD00019534_016890 [Acytostelium subglobosum LB1]
MSNPLLALKLKQIETLKSKCPTIKEITKDSTYKIPLLNGAHLIISLPMNFPSVPPAYFLESHDGQTLATKPPAWGQMTSLAKITMEYLDFYSKHPPQFLQQQQQQQNNYSPPPSYYSSASPQQPLGQSGGAGQPPPPYTASKDQKNVQKPIIPSLPTRFPELESKTKEELLELLKSDELEVFLFSIDEVSAMSAQKERLQADNEKLSAPIEQKQRSLEELKVQLAEQQALYKELKLQSEEKQKKKEAIQRAFSAAVLVERLTEAASISEAESDSIANEFLEGNIDLKEFKKQFKDKRNIYHSRLAKKESIAKDIK